MPETKIVNCALCDCVSVEEADDPHDPCECECHGGTIVYLADGTSE